MTIDPTDTQLKAFFIGGSATIHIGFFVALYIWTGISAIDAITLCVFAAVFLPVLSMYALLAPLWVAATVKELIWGKQ